MEQTFKPGSLAPQDGLYIKVDSTGREINNAFSMKKGEKFPPTQSEDVAYKIY